jgi:hypothetical protein
MTGGFISGNQAGSSRSGGGVYFASTGTFTMTGGFISGNEASDGGGVYVYSGTFTKSGGIIYGDTDTAHDSGSDENTAASGSGHAVYVDAGPEKRNSTAGPGVVLDSAISGPSGGWDGSSGYIQTLITAALPGDTITLPAGTYDMTASVTFNKIITITTEPGAAVRLLRQSGHTDVMIEVTGGGGLTLKTGTDGSLTLDGNGSIVTANAHLVKVTGNLTIESGVTLSGNKITNTAVGGSGVFVNNGTFTMSGGTISGNEAGSGGGGVAVNIGSFNMTGGTIGGNESSTGNGGGVVVGSSGTFTKNGGIIYGSDAPFGQANTASGSGQAVYASSGSKSRNTTAGPGVDLNSSTGTSGVAPWE